MILVGKEGVTEDVDKAISFIIIKELANKKFERLDYQMKGSLIKRQTYKDTAMQILDGSYYEYKSNGYILFAGEYINNQKEGDWLTFDDTGKIAAVSHYKNGKYIGHDDSQPSESVADGTTNAEFSEGLTGWLNYLSNALSKTNVSNYVTKNGSVVVNFTIDANGKTKEIYISKSELYTLDEEAFKIIENSPLWIPASQGGISIEAHRRQPFKFVPQ